MNGIVVHEFELINEQLLKDKMRDNGIHDYNDEFQQLVNFIDEFNATEDNVDAYELLSVKKNRILGTYISFKNYVGLIELKNGFQLEILPKIDMSNNDIDTRKVFLRMLKSMKEFEGKNFNVSNLGVDRMNLYEIFINMFLREVEHLVKKGLKGSYVNQEENLSVCKGKLIFKEQIKKNLVHKEKFFVSYDEFNINRSENKLIKTTLIKLLHLSNNSDNKKLCAQTLSHFEGVDVSTNYDYDFSKVAIDRTVKEYENLIRWSRVFLKNKSFTTFSGESVARALLFPMEKLFEAFVAKNIFNLFTDCEVSIQDSGFYLFNEPIERFSLRPDLVIKMKNNNLVIMDTKWKRLIDDPNKNYGISQSDMYQMYAYAKKYKTPDIWLLYPLNNEMSSLDQIGFKSDDDVNVHVFFVDVSNIEKNLCELRQLLGSQ